ncbi:LuxR C-terminal-related transcriptional regulator [Streptomyces sp. NPDC088196]|uniref:response regulator transcription factor n=1 Tax=Streptomyces sp. NPDC088196 TaxID=3154868 RepID=UPI00344B3B76
MGTAGILLQDTAAQHVPWVVPAISSGCRVVSPEISESVISEYLRSSATTSQERLVARGMSNREIASALFISPETVKDHVRAIRAKLGAPTRVHAARVAWLAHSANAGSAA